MILTVVDHYGLIYSSKASTNGVAVMPPRSNSVTVPPVPATVLL